MASDLTRGVRRRNGKRGALSPWMVVAALGVMDVAMSAAQPGRPDGALTRSSTTSGTDLFR